VRCRLYLDNILSEETLIVEMMLARQGNVFLGLERYDWDSYLKRNLSPILAQLCKYTLCQILGLKPLIWQKTSSSKYNNNISVLS
jgi:hypothetical protein